MFRYAVATCPLAWINTGGDVIDFNFTLTTTDTTTVAPKAEGYINALETYATTAGIPYELTNDDLPNILIGCSINSAVNIPHATASFILQKIGSDQTITGNANDFYQLVITYGNAVAFKTIFERALLEYSTTAQLKDYVITNLVINEYI